MSPTPGGRGEEENKLQSNDAMCISHLPHNKLNPYRYCSYFSVSGLVTVRLRLQLGLAPYFSHADGKRKIFLCMLSHVLLFKLIVPVINLGNRAWHPKCGAQVFSLAPQTAGFILVMTCGEGLSNLMNKPRDRRLEDPSLFDMICFHLYIL